MDTGNILRRSQNTILNLLAIFGGAFSLVELSCYVAIFLYTRKMTNSMGSLLRESVIRERHRCNAISLLGQIVSWFIEFWYACIVGLVVNFYDSDLLREVTPILKHLDFVLIPLVQV